MTGVILRSLHATSATILLEVHLRKTHLDWNYTRQNPVIE